LATLILRRSAAHPVTPPYLTLVAPLAMVVHQETPMLGELAQEAPAMQANDGSSDALLQGVPAQVEPIIDDVPLGVDNNDGRDRALARRCCRGSLSGLGGARFRY
jgi:hypothetical protein